MAEPLSGLPANDLALDVKSAGRLKQLAQQNPELAIKKSAQQFEAIFINMMLQTMRKASFNSGLLQSHEKTLYTSMFDQQISQTLANKGMGLASVLQQQLLRQQGGLSASQTPRDALAAGSADSLAGLAAYQSAQANRYGSLKAFDTLDVDKILSDWALRAPGSEVSAKASATASQFYSEMAPYAQQASQESGIPANFILAQAALESGWGQRDIRNADGSPSYNLFGIKASADWQGKVAEVSTTEYVQGQAQRQQAQFRSYASPAEAFSDYARFLQRNPRYQSVLSQASTAEGFAYGLQRAGYATDPAYAQKLLNVIKRLETA